MKINKCKQVIFEDLESFLRAIQTEDDDNNFILQKFTSNFETYEIPSDLPEVGVNNNTLENLIVFLLILSQSTQVWEQAVF